uniref:Uncharacterized protein n=1 Tax=Pararge aegeria TaxID=116150 RepID=S4NV90_9NEOP
MPFLVLTIAIHLMSPICIDVLFKIIYEFDATRNTLQLWQAAVRRNNHCSGHTKKYLNICLNLSAVLKLHIIFL